MASPSPEEGGIFGRRTFLSLIGVALSALAGALIATPPVAFVVSPWWRRTRDVWRRVGKVGSFTIGKTVEVVIEDPSPLKWAGVTAKTGVWLRRDQGSEFTAFSMNCSHLGCPVRWEEGAQLFMCPCHGGVYYSDGAVAAGPPPRGLTRMPVRIRDGEVEVRTAPIPIT